MPVKNEAEEEKRRIAKRQTAIVPIFEHPNENGECVDEEIRDNSSQIAAVAYREPNQDAPDPNKLKTNRITSSTMISSVENDLLCFCDVSTFSSAVPSISSGTMNLLAPIIEDALANDSAWNDDLVQAQREKVEPNLCKALVPYRPPFEVFAFHLFRNNTPNSEDESNEATPPVMLKPATPVAPRKSNPNQDENLANLNTALRRLNLEEEMAGETVLWHWREKAVIDATMYENINSPENFDDLY